MLPLPRRLQLPLQELRFQLCSGERGLIAPHGTSRVVGEHEGGWLPFAFDVTNALVEGMNRIAVRVDSPVDCEQTHADGPLGEVPFGKQSWYGPQSGLWQSVRLVDHF